MKQAQRLAKEKFKAMFSFWSKPEYYYYYDPLIFNQKRFKDGSQKNDRFLYHITHTTKQIFENMDIESH